MAAVRFAFTLPPTSIAKAFCCSSNFAASSSAFFFAISVCTAAASALDCARILAKTKEEFYGSDIMDYALNILNTSKIENIFVIGRRTPKDAKFTIAELRELGELLEKKKDGR